MWRIDYKRARKKATSSTEVIAIILARDGLVIAMGSEKLLNLGIIFKQSQQFLLINWT